MNKRGTILIENVIFIILNVLFLSIIIVFLSNQASGVHTLEEVYAKKIALITDYAKPEMVIKLDMDKAMKAAEKNNLDFRDAVKVTGNVINVNLKPGEKGYSYSFFNDVMLCVYPDKDISVNEYTGLYVLTITKKVEGRTCTD